jgi:hypothetical protein
MILKKIPEIFPTWTNSTKEEHPSRNTFGYNTEENRLEFYIKELDKWLYLWSEFIAITEVPTIPYFLETFETGWFIDNTFSQLFIEDLETNWFINNIFNQIFIESFEGGW